MLKTPDFHHWQKRESFYTTRYFIFIVSSLKFLLGSEKDKNMSVGTTPVASAAVNGQKFRHLFSSLNSWTRHESDFIFQANRILKCLYDVSFGFIFEFMSLRFCIIEIMDWKRIIMMTYISYWKWKRESDLERYLSSIIERSEVLKKKSYYI